MIFVGSLIRKEEEKVILNKSLIGLSFADNLLQRNIIEGIEHNIGTSITIVNTPNMGSFPKKNRVLFRKSKKWPNTAGSVNHEVGFVNLPIIKHLFIFINLRNKLFAIINENKKHNDLIIYSTYLPFLLAAYTIPKRIKITLVATDLPEYYFHSNIGRINKAILKVYNKIVYRCLKRIDKFVLLTEAMKKPLDVGDKPYIVVEGMIKMDTELNVNRNPEIIGNNKKIVMYSGGLHFDYGIMTLLQAFQMIEGENYELWICGSGEAEDEIKRFSRSDSRIIFYGYVDHMQNLELQSKATVLVNPRESEEQYTKYSFPSKILEYMKSGKPVIMHKLSCIPDEYDPYVVYFPENSVKTVSDTIIKICEMNPESRKKLGESAKKYVEDNKNCFEQTAKIVKLIKK